ncbi:MAG TPA: hypothetical protein VM577_07150 [Anaerovoracaceae bacterium]|nr:hypothetical protein [Anaerovoracaceae bacterium]
MAIKKFNPADLLKAASKFEQLVKEAQGTYQYSADPMKKALDQVIGKKVQDIAAKFLNEKAISSLQVNIGYQSPEAANFSVFATGTDKDAAEKEMAAALANLGPTVAKTMAKFQKTPLDYKYAEFEK